MENTNLNQNSLQSQNSSFVDSSSNSPKGDSIGSKPIHLIYYDPSSKTFKVSEEAKNFLKSIKERVGVISVAGKYRTGKSFLLNRVIINKKNQGFGVGPTINPCTKGLWIWGETLETEYQGEKLKVLLIDSEGIGAFDEDDNHDTKIFLLALLLCSYFIYNSMGTIDENAINNLSLIINLSKELQIKSEVLGDSDPDEIAKYFPSFLWVVRDFSLRLLDTFGNAISQKEYFENSLQPQKGTSDNVETKNRIRRLIRHFFKDRDCFTMVRPVEEEKELQNLQQMEDSMMRTEFVQQINYLRSKIFKKVKPKTLNSKFLNGEMILELCYSYTEAINTGTLPNIQNAWSYVCQNECQRAIQDSISMYEQQMRKILVEAKELCKEDLITKEHRLARDQCVAVFKSKAVGQEIQEFESQLREGISKKHKDIKQDFLRHCKTKAYQFLENDVNLIKKNLQNDMFLSIEQFQEDIEKLKTKYNEQGPLFTGRNEILQEICYQLMCKAADFMGITSRKENDSSLRKLQDRVTELERERLIIKQDFKVDKSKLEEKVFELETQRNQAIRNEKLLEERIKYQAEEKDKIEKNLTQKWKVKIEEKDLLLKELESKLKQLEGSMKQSESENYKKVMEFEKLNALIEQKLQLTENELHDYKNKYSAKDQDYKDVNKELYNSKKEQQQLTNQMHRVEQEKNDEIKQIKQDYETQIQELQKQTFNSGNPQVSDHQEKKWIQERQSMETQMKIMMEQLESSKKFFQESLMQALNNQRTQSPDRKSDQKIKEKNKELVMTNQNLSQQIVQMQAKQLNLEKYIAKIKKFKYMIDYAIALQCKNCNMLFPTNQYNQHLPECNQRASTLNAYQVSVYDFIISNVQKNGHEYLYEITIERSYQSWKVNKSIFDFKTFFETLILQFPNYQLPFIREEWLGNDNISFYQNELKDTLQSFLLDLARIPFIRDNSLFKQFLEVDHNFSETDPLLGNGLNSHHRHFQSMGSQSLNAMMSSQGQQMSNIMGRSSVLNPFTQSQVSNIGNLSKTMDNRKSVMPSIKQGLLNINGFIQELAEDEDTSSIASKNRVSQMMQMADEIRPSVFSIRNQEAQKIDNVFTSKTNSPFQVEASFKELNSKSNERYSVSKHQEFTTEPRQFEMDEEEQDDFESSFSQDMCGDFSVSSKKHCVSSAFPHENDPIHISKGKGDENSPPTTEIVKSKINLIKQFENEASTQGSSSSMLNKKVSRYEDGGNSGYQEEEDEIERDTTPLQL